VLRLAGSVRAYFVLAGVLLLVAAADLWGSSPFALALLVAGIVLIGIGALARSQFLPEDSPESGARLAGEEPTAPSAVPRDAGRRL
jgi:hypothetical protein